MSRIVAGVCPGGLSALAGRGNPTFAAGANATAAPVAVFLRT